MIRRGSPVRKAAARVRSAGGGGGGGGGGGAGALRRRLPLGALLVALLVIFSATTFFHTHVTHQAVHQNLRDTDQWQTVPKVAASADATAREEAEEPPRGLPVGLEEADDRSPEVQQQAGDELADPAAAEELHREAEASQMQERNPPGVGADEMPVIGEEGHDASVEEPLPAGAQPQPQPTPTPTATPRTARSKSQRARRREARAAAAALLPDGAGLPPSAASLMRKEGQSIEDALAAMDAALDGGGFKSIPYATKTPPPTSAPDKVGETKRKKIVTEFFKRMKEEAFALIGAPDDGGLAGGGADTQGGGAADGSELPADVAAENFKVAAAAGGVRLGNPAVDDTARPCRLSCRPHGYCHAGRCVCMAAWTGVICNQPLRLPLGLTGDWEGDIVANQRGIVAAGGMNLTTNPKASESIGHGRTHSLIAPYEPAFPRPERLLRKGGEALFRQRPVITSASLKLFPEVDFLAHAVYNTCALVGSSGINLLYRDGPGIDAHDAVIRFNSAPTLKKKGDYAEHVGRKTSFRFINTQHITFDEGGEWRFQQMQSKNALMRYFRMKQDNPGIHLAAFAPSFTQYGGHGIPHHYFNSEEPLQARPALPASDTPRAAAPPRPARQRVCDLSTHGTLVTPGG
eukprot:jgi/Tetstr1/454796/TSEL_041676.t1